MSDKHPIDEFFRQQLQNHSYEPPMHLWEKVDAQRQAARSSSIPHFGLYKLLNVLSVIALLSAGAVLWIPRSTAPESPALQNDTSPPEATVASIPPAPTGPESYSLLVSKKIAPASTLSQSEQLTIVAVLPVPQADLSQSIPDIRALAPVVRQAGDEMAPPTATIPTKRTTLASAPRTGDITCAKFEEHRIWRSTVDFMVSPDLVSRELQAVSPQYEEYAAARNTTEHFRYGFSAGVRFSTIAPSGLAVRSGLNYSQINEQFSYRNDQEERVTITTEYGPGGQVIGTDTVVDYFSTRRTVNNRYTTIDIPLIFGYEFKAGNHFGVAINGGTFINMLFTQQGEFLSPATFEPVQFSGDTPDTYHAYRNRLGLAFYGSVGLTYRITDDLDLLVEPHIKWRPQSITAPGYVLQQRFFTSGLFLGLRKRV